MAAAALPALSHARADAPLCPLAGQVFCGYQGWFSCPGDGTRTGWRHYGKGGVFAPGKCGIEIWPDVSDLAPQERFSTEFRHADGSTAQVFSSALAPTVDRHFQWMAEYGIAGAFVQRFGVEARDRNLAPRVDRVLWNCRHAARSHHRKIATMYDLSGLDSDGVLALRDDWRGLVRDARLTADPAYLRWDDRPLVAVWGVGFNDGRRYSLDACRELIRFLTENPEADQCRLVLGVPTGWRTLDRDAVDDPTLHEIVAMADVISPWTVGRYRNPDEVRRHAEQTWAPDIAWCHQRGIGYLPVIFPGFSWTNLKGGDSVFDAIPRRQGEFYWSQVAAAREAGAEMLYGAMFDELDEATALFKCTDTPPVGESRFLTMDGLPSDHYLWLTGQAARALRDEIPDTPTAPTRRN